MQGSFKHIALPGVVVVAFFFCVSYSGQWHCRSSTLVFSLVQEMAS